MMKRQNTNRFSLKRPKAALGNWNLIDIAAMNRKVQEYKTKYRYSDDYVKQNPAYIYMNAMREVVDSGALSDQEKAQYMDFLSGYAEVDKSTGKITSLNSHTSFAGLRTSFDKSYDDAINRGIYNESILQQFYDARDWNGAANYLSKVKVKDMSKAAKAHQYIAGLRRKAAIEQAKLESMTADQKEAYDFIQSFDPTGTLPQNSYGKSYMELANQYAKDYGALTIGFENEDVFNAFMNRLPDDDYRRNAMMSTSITNGYRSINVDPRNPWAFITYVNAATNNMGDETAIFSPKWGKVGLELIKNGEAWEEIKQLVNQITHWDKYERPLRLYETGLVQGVGFGRWVDAGNGQKRFVGDDLKSLAPLDRIMANYWKAKTEMDEWSEKMDETTFQEESVTIPYLGKEHINAYKQWRAGLIKGEEYDRLTKEFTRQFNLQVMGTDLHSYDVYSSRNSENGADLNKVDESEKQDIVKKLKAAAADNRVEYQAGMVGDMMGAFITITPYMEKGETKTDDQSNTAGLEVIFIPGFLGTEAQESFNANTQNKATVESRDMQRWGYGRTLVDGTTVGFDKQSGFYITDKDNNKRVASNDEILRKLNQDYIVNDAAEALVSHLDANGELFDYDAQGNRVKLDINNWALTQASEAVNELYPQGQFSNEERLFQQSEIYRMILETIAHITENVQKEETEE